jgi:hypothetical protein
LIDRRRAYIEAIEEYEKKLVALEKDLRSSLQKEAERRREAEYHASQLKKKVAELQFLLEEKLAEDDEEEEEDDDSDEEKRS